MNVFDTRLANTIKFQFDTPFSVNDGDLETMKRNSLKRIKWHIRDRRKLLNWILGKVTHVNAILSSQKLPTTTTDERKKSEERRHDCHRFRDISGLSCNMHLKHDKVYFLIFFLLENW